VPKILTGNAMEKIPNFKQISITKIQNPKLVIEIFDLFAI